MAERASAHEQRGWLPAGKRAALVFSVDDVHPAGAEAPYEAGGACAQGALGRVEALLSEHAELRATLFVTPDWRPISVVPTRRRLARIPVLRDGFVLAPTWPAGTMRLERHPHFVAYLKSLPRCEIAAHGLHHLHSGPRLTVEFQRQSRARCASMLQSAKQIFEAAGLPLAPGFAPPSWHAPPNLLDALGPAGFRFVNAARDLTSAISPDAVCCGSGLHGVSLLEPTPLGNGRPLNIPVNYQATSSPQRAFDIVEAGGLVSIKAHVAKHMTGHVMLDGLDDVYVEHLAALFRELERRYGDSLWWTSMGEIAAYCDRHKLRRAA